MKSKQLKSSGLAAERTQSRTPPKFSNGFNYQQCHFEIGSDKRISRHLSGSSFDNRLASTAVSKTWIMPGMKSTKTRPRKTHAAFWDWFGENAEALSADTGNSALLTEIDNRIRDLSPLLSWEIGPGRSKPWQFVVSPSLDRSLRNLARQIISSAPTLRDWEFHSARQSKDWNYKFELKSNLHSTVISLDASSWTFVLLRYPEGTHEILLKGSELPLLTPDEREQAAAIVLVSILGEDTFLDTVDEFELVDVLDPRFAEKQKPIWGLRDAVIGSADGTHLSNKLVN